VRLPVHIARGERRDIVLELRGDLRAAAAERPRHRRVHHRAVHISRVELIDDLRHFPQSLIAHAGVVIHAGEIIAAEHRARGQAGGVPVEADAVERRGRRGRHTVGPAVVEHRLAAPGAAHRLGECVDVLSDCLVARALRVERLVDELDGDDRRVILVRQTRVAVHVVHVLAQVVALRLPGLRVRGHLVHGEEVRKPAALLRPTPPGDRGHDTVDAPALALADQQVQ